jgi:hypothetical protein
VNDYTKTVVLPENALTKAARTPRRERDDGADTDFDKTLVLEDELDKRRRRRSSSNPAR